MPTVGTNKKNIHGTKLSKTTAEIKCLMPPPEVAGGRSFLLEVLFSDEAENGLEVIAGNVILRHKGATITKGVGESGMQRQHGISRAGTTSIAHATFANDFNIFFYYFTPMFFTPTPRDIKVLTSLHFISFHSAHIQTNCGDVSPTLYK